MSADAAVVFPVILWAQRPEYVLLSIPLQDATNVAVEIREGRTLRFSATAGGKKYGCAFELFRDVCAEESGHVVLPRQIELRLKKRQASGDDAEENEVCRAWPRLALERAKNRHFQVDWSRWRDDDGGSDSDDEQNSFGVNYDDLMSQIISEKVPDENESMSARNALGEDDNKGKQGDNISTSNIQKKNSDDDEDGDYDDLPSLEEE